MTKRSVSFAMVIVVLCAFLAGTGVTKSVYDAQDKVTQYSFPRTDRELVKAVKLTEAEMMAAAQNRPSVRSSLGSSGTSGPDGVGITVKHTWEDWQYYYKQRRIDFGYFPSGASNHPSIQFAYIDKPSSAETAPEGMAYNVYDPTGGGGWPRGIDGGCRIQATDVTGANTNIAIYPDGRVVIAGHDDASGDMEHHLYGNIALHGCFWGGGSQLAPAQFTQGFFNSENVMYHPAVAVQLIGTDTITHMIGGEQMNNYAVPTPDDRMSWAPAQYFRRVNDGGGITGATWTGPTTLDTVSARPHLCVSPTDSKVAVTYFRYTPRALQDPYNDHDQDVFYRESPDGGLSWDPKVNITNYDRTQTSYAPWIEKYAMYDTEGELHIIWEGNPWPEDVYDSTGFFFGDFSCSLHHWSTRTGQISRIANRDYGLDWNSQVCGMGGYNTHYPLIT